jgi:hypothetical protein
MAAGMLLDRGHGKAAQLVDVQGEVKQIVAIELNVVYRDHKSLEPSLTKLLTNPENTNDINGAHLSASDSCAGRRAR